ncbi:hypothetical protein BD309DRAFT_967388 [Dichomitus squalens]|uniref:Uncharacterized protein n=1 Tax=Dichomitus squalens TaxID=114155 RepID=A0A4Q9NLB1_9APHY|nr:hypothetical protein BD309DRAFT_967388 [Dichomitus squalens]TBU56939.1 hypothetical protein BD310DRAFT_930564 [Dichomitus squalens]
MRVNQKDLLAFVVAHDRLREIDMRYSYIFPDDSQHAQVIPHPSLQILTCRTPLLSSQTPVPTNLTHFYRPYLLSRQLPGIVALLGPQLVSLRVGECFPIERSSPWSLLDVVTNFPRLRFFHVEMFHTSLPSLGTTLVDWFRDRQASRVLIARPKIVLAWTNKQQFLRTEKQEIEWDQYVDKFAVRVLTEWDNYIERIIYRHSARPYISVTLDAAGGMGGQLVKAEDTDMRDDYWKHV